ncbi:hypothetical protein LGK99_12550 [Clostridium algidicarnis]|uniref:type I restriction endonuclease n=1 Tax=Clostridium algidicarnis TaxID=37659 RepID=UPI001C0CF4B7|nr:type I restriction endonuclease [Clostridium algidicarnis]MBU3196524.1 hypothetical protein [Clostridium algidicarnis]MCB2287903.1 hypothetical protein [Clostridium algidicarnis]
MKKIKICFKVNCIQLIVVELKSASAENLSTDEAYNQIKTYKNDNQVYLTTMLFIFYLMHMMNIYLAVYLL